MDFHNLACRSVINLNEYLNAWNMPSNFPLAPIDRIHYSYGNPGKQNAKKLL